MAKDQTEVGITGKPIPKPRTARQQYELEKKRRMQKHLGTNVGGTQYTSGARYYVPSTSATNPRARTFEEFMGICEAVSASDRKLAQSGILSKRADDLQREIDAVSSGKKSSPTKSASRKVTKQSYEVREESEANNKPATKEEKRRIRMMQQLERLKREKSASRIQSDVAKEEYEIDEAKVPVTRQAGDFRYSGRTGEEKAERRANVLSKSPDPARRRQANTIRKTIKTVADRDTAQASSDARQKLYRGQQTRANELARELMKSKKDN